ncbi:MAG: molybdopterin oxidoreductase family protein, partial [Pseudomonadales bacterium]
RAVCYGRMGCSTQEFGTLCQWLTQVINILTGNLDEPGGMMLTSPAVDMIGGSNGGGFGKPGHFNRHQSRVSGLPEFGGELPASCMAEEITTPGEGQIKLMITSAGNPVLSTPSGHTLASALEQLDFMLSIDLYINETTQYADVILPPTSPLEHDHYDLIFHHFAVRNTSKYSAPVFEKPESSLHDWEIFTQLGKRLGKVLDKKPKPSLPPDQLVDMGLQIGQYELTLDMLKEKPEGIDLGPLQSCMPERLFTENKRIKCLPEPLPAELQRLANSLSKTEDSLLMIGRRHVRNNNSWMHQYHRLIKGANRCTLLINPDDAKNQGVADGDTVTLENEAGSITLPIELSDSMMPGVVCMPHGFGHNAENSRVSTATDNAGVSMNDVIPTNAYDPLSGNAAVNGVPVSLSRA